LELFNLFSIASVTGPIYFELKPDLAS
jgi:hypothetical protein